MADFDTLGSQNPKPILMKLGMVDYVRDPTPHDNFGGVAQCGWSGQIRDLSHLWVSFSFFAFFSVYPGRISWPIGTIYMPKRVFPAQDMSWQYPTTFTGNDTQIQYQVLTFDSMQKIFYSMLVQTQSFLIVFCTVFFRCLCHNINGFLKVNITKVLKNKLHTQTQTSSSLHFWIN